MVPIPAFDQQHQPENRQLKLADSPLVYFRKKYKFSSTEIVNNYSPNNAFKEVPSSSTVFSHNLASISIPKTDFEALNHRDGKQAMQNEITALIMKHGN